MSTWQEHRDAGGERITRSVEVDENGCWIWQKSINRLGYGLIKSQGRTRTSHRVAYEVFIGPVPDGLDLDHLCRVRACCNPEHLEPVTRRENALRSPLMGGKTACKHGHEFTPENTQIRVRNGVEIRQCLACRRDYYRRYYRRALEVAGTPRQRRGRYDNAPEEAA